ncbi:hypothetical protein ColKHC_03222 [Colletotrichum higginsianum]|nr:hypothetical protein ColKHC_03222 [Colletotrichum higginsianum]
MDAEARLGDAGAVQLAGPPLCREAGEVEVKVGRELDAVLLGADGAVLGHLGDGLGRLAREVPGQAQVLLAAQLEAVVEARRGRDAGAEVDEAAEQLKGQADGDVGRGVDAHVGRLGDVGVAAVLGLPARRRGPGAVDEVEVDVGGGQGDAQAGRDADGGRDVKVEADGEGDARAKLDDARDGDEGVGQLVGRVLERVAVGGGDVDRDADGRVEGGVEVEVEGLEAEAPEVVLEVAREGDGRAEPGLVGRDVDVLPVAEEDGVVGERLGEGQRDAGVERQALGERRGGQGGEGHLALAGDVGELLAGGGDGDGQRPFVRREARGEEEAALELGVAVAEVVRDEDEAAVRRRLGPVLDGLAERVGVGEGHGEPVVGADDGADGVDVLEDHGRVLEGERHVDGALLLLLLLLLLGLSIGVGVVRGIGLGCLGRRRVVQRDIDGRDDVDGVLGVDARRGGRAEGVRRVGGRTQLLGLGLDGERLEGRDVLDDVGGLGRVSVGGRRLRQGRGEGRSRQGRRHRRRLLGLVGHLDDDVRHALDAVRRAAAPLGMGSNATCEEERAGQEAAGER